MKKILIVATVMVFVIAMAGGAFAGAVAGPIVPVNATVSEKCIVSTNGSINVALDPSLAGAAQTWTVIQPQAKCTKTPGVTTAAVSVTGNGPADSTGNFVSFLHQGGYADIPYTFTYNQKVAGNGFGSGADVNFGISASITDSAVAAATYSTTPYTDTVTMTLTY